jgi:hypothetical protein
MKKESYESSAKIFVIAIIGIIVVVLTLAACCRAQLNYRRN